MQVRRPRHLSAFRLRARAGLLVVALACSATGALGQVFFYFENNITHPGDSAVTYFTLLTLYNNGTGVARVRYKEPSSGESRLFEISLRDSAGVDGAHERFMVQDGDAIPIEGPGDSYHISPKFAFHKQMEGDEVSFVPTVIRYQWPDGRWYASEMLVSQQRSRIELRNERELVSFFYNETEDFYLYLYAVRGGHPGTEKRKEKLYLIAVANTLDSTVGVSTRRDVVNIERLFTRIANGLNMDIVVQKIMDEGFGKTAVEFALAKLQPSPVDIVIFYYSGHGFRYTNDASLYPRMSLRLNRRMDLDKNNIGVEAVYKTLLRKKARVTIVLSDCCNEDIGSPVPLAEEFIRMKSTPSVPPLNMGLCKQLFFPPKPVGILIGSADKNQLAVCSNALGGFFTNSFTAELEKNLYQFAKPGATWRSILLASRQNAFNLSLGADCGKDAARIGTGTERCMQMARFVVTP